MCSILNEKFMNITVSQEKKCEKGKLETYKYQKIYNEEAIPATTIWLYTASWSDYPSRAFYLSIFHREGCLFMMEIQPIDCSK